MTILQFVGVLIGLFAGVTTLYLGGCAFLNVRDKFIRERAENEISGKFFLDVLRLLASPNGNDNLAGAILLRRFFRPSNYRQPYADDAVDTIVAILRDTETGTFQKTLADGLGYAPTLAKADFQEANLENVRLDRRSCGTVDVSEADFYNAKLSGGSLREAIARGAVFYQADLTGTVLVGADLRGADFRGAILTRANLNDADLAEAKFDNETKLDGARFVDAKNVPSEISVHLDETKTFRQSASS